MVLNRRRLSFDVTGAYLQGEYSDDEVVYARPPRGYETFDDCGIMLVWWMPMWMHFPPVWPGRRGPDLVLHDPRAADG